MALCFFNTLTRQLEEFHPREQGVARFYMCGPTVYGFAHIGNFRTFLFGDLIRRYLAYKGYKVIYVMNITDVDDKIIRDSMAAGETLKQFTGRFTDSFLEDLDILGAVRPDIQPRATDHIAEMVAMVQSLAAQGRAYEVDGNWYYKISAFPNYGKLANLDMSGLKAGARVASDEYEKESVSDFALWKAWDEKDGAVFWETAIGKGRPGWHLECSAMSMKYLGETFDLHAGGVDLMFPHHENEIAQSEGSTGKQFVKYWLHAEHLIVEGKKMSKSLGNFYTLRDILAKGYAPKAVRYLLMSAHYRQQLNFTFDGLDGARAALERYNDFIRNLDSHTGASGSGEGAAIVRKAAIDFEAQLDDDLNISGGLGVIFDFIRDINRLKADGKLSTDDAKAALALIRKFDTIFSFELPRVSLDDQVNALIAERQDARKSRNFKRSDEIRDQLASMGILLEDTPHGVTWKRKM